MIVLEIVIHAIAGYAVGHWLGMLFIKIYEAKQRKKRFNSQPHWEDIEVKLIAKKIKEEMDRGRYR